MSRRNGGIIGPTNTPVGGLFKGVAGGVWRMNDVLTFVSNNQWPSGPQSIDNSCRFNDGDSPTLSRSVSGTTQSTTGTISFWFKRSTISADQRVFTNYIDANNYGGIKLQSDDKLEIVVVDGGSVTGKLTTSQIFRDTSAWYNCVVAIDSSNSTAGDRMRLYINGSEVTNFDTDTNPSSSATMEFFTDGTNRIGQFNSSQYFDGYLAEFVMIHGQQLTPSSFGETDSTTGIWKPKKIGSFTSAGDNSFYLDFKDSSNLGNDASGLSNTFTVSGLTSLDQTTDTCVVNYSTMLPIGSYKAQTAAYSEGNLKVDNIDNQDNSLSSFALSSGKWYFETKINDSYGYTFIGLFPTSLSYIQTDIYERTGYWGYYGANGQKRVNGSASSYGNSFGQNDIIGMAIDLDNDKLYFSKNGTFQDSGDPTSGSTGTGAISLSTYDEWRICYGFGSGTNGTTVSVNFGNPIHSISSGNSDANGFGNFEYAVPSGYYAINTTNLNTYG